MTEARRALISKNAYLLLESARARSYPVNLKTVLNAPFLREKRIETESAERYAAYFGKPFPVKDWDGYLFTFESDDFYIVFYNGAKRPISRVIWTILHEIAHALLAHTDKDAGESEANRFTALVLCHPLILSRCGISDSSSVKKLCAVSESAARITQGELQKPFAANVWDYKIADLFDGFCARRVCSACRLPCDVARAPFCAACGSKTFTRSVDIFLDDVFNKTPRCPVCDNEAAQSGAFCEICGVRRLNVCPECKSAVSAGFTFCVYCGARLK